MVNDTGWMDHAACVGVDPELFFAHEQDILARTRALAICASCPVAAQCLAWGIKHGLRYGIYGGMTRTARDRWRKLNGITLPYVPRIKKDHGSGAAYRNHSREGTPICEQCKAWSRETRAKNRVKQRELA